MEIALYAAAVLAVLCIALLWYVVRALLRIVAENQRLLASPGYMAFAQGRPLEAKADRPAREPTESEIAAEAERQLVMAAQDDPMSGAGVRLT